MAGPVRLVRGGDRPQDADALASALGGRVGLDGVLADLNREARSARVPGSASAWGFELDREDSRSRRWWPQGITTSAERSRDGELYQGRPLVVTTAYAREVRGLLKGSRITVFDLSDPRRVRYRHVLLVEASSSEDGALGVRPVPVHAGGVAWHGRRLHVAATARGLVSFDLADVVRVPAGADPGRLGPQPGGGFAGFGHRYLLPVRERFTNLSLDAVPKPRYSFVSLDASRQPPEVIAGEYGRGEQTTRLLRFPLDPTTSLPRTDDTGACEPTAVHLRGVPGMQGAVRVGEQWYITTSNGRRGRGSMWTGTPGALREHAEVLPAGPEDLTYWPSTDQLWSLTEHPGARYVFAMDRRRFG